MPTDPTSLVMTIVAAVAVIRKQIPKVDGLVVLAVAAAVSVLVSFGASPDGAPVRQVIFQAGWLWVLAVGGMSGFQWAAGKIGESIGKNGSSSDGGRTNSTPTSVYPVPVPVANDSKGESL